MKAYSKDLRVRVLAAVDRGVPRQEIAGTFSVSVSTSKRYLRLRRQTGGVGRNPDLTLAEHCELFEEEHGIGISTATMSRVLKSLGLPLKKRR